MQTFRLKVAEVMEVILPELDPTGQAVYLALIWRAHGHGQSYCEISQKGLATACGITSKTAKAPLKALAIARLINVEQGGTKSYATRYRVHLAREAGIKRYWEVPVAWRQAILGTQAPMLVNALEAEDRAVLEGMYEALGQGERVRLAIRHVRAPDSTQAEAFRAVAGAVAARISVQALRPLPLITIH